ncbi:IS66 family transposase [Sinorhizobium fredii]|uniref:IS66 family insertion sequence transposase protein n=1 Tax=Rhizobium fredii TaxID=380 RepID=A0A2L0HBV4_RHIFR|nr:IS66 family transposase [Sinorhizobium fredii]AUX78924.1 IS66 family insertion sequence transposase protein [Sinorhizobium fredii]
MMPPDLNLPDDVEALKAMVLAVAEKAARVDALESEVADLKARNAEADERIERLTQILKAFDRARFGRRSEKLGSPSTDDEQQAFVFEEIETGIAAVRAQVNKGCERPNGKRPPRPRKGFAPHLERVEVVIEPEELPEHAGNARDDRTFGGSGPPMVAYRFEDSRAGECVARHLSRYRGILQVDGYAAYNKLVRSDGGNDGVTLAGCRSHGRRKFHELYASESSKVATETVERMAKLWQVEETVRGQSPDARVAARQQTSAAIVTDLFALRQKSVPRVSGKSKLAEALRYPISRRAIFERFLSDGRIELDSNTVERAIRPQAIRRKNSLFAGSDGGGRTWATIATLLQTSKLNNVDPFDWLTPRLERIADGWPSSEIDALMPWNHAG